MNRLSASGGRSNVNPQADSFNSVRAFGMADHCAEHVDPYVRELNGNDYLFLWIKNAAEADVDAVAIWKRFEDGHRHRRKAWRQTTIDSVDFDCYSIIGNDRSHGRMITQEAA